MKLRRLRIDKGWSPEELAFRAEVSARTIQNLERGVRPQAKTAFRVAQAFGLKPSDIWPDDEREAA